MYIYSCCLFSPITLHSFSEVLICYSNNCVLFSQNCRGGCENGRTDPRDDGFKGIVGTESNTAVQENGGGGTLVTDLISKVLEESDQLGLAHLQGSQEKYDILTFI